MKCPSDAVRLRALLGELSVNDARALEEHTQGCPTCSAALRQHALLLADLAAPPPALRSAEAFTSAVMGARQHGRKPARPPTRPLARWMLAAAAVLALTFPLRSLLQRGDIDDGMVARGGHTPERVFAELFTVRDGVFTSLPGAASADRRSPAQVHPGDALAVRCTNTRAGDAQLMVFALDSALRVHWLYPAFLDARTDPSSVRVAAGTRDRIFDELVEPEQPARGPLRVFAVWSSEPLHVSDVERRQHEFANGGRPTWLARYEVQEWSTVWSE